MQDNKKSSKNRNKIVVYLMVLFLVAFLLMLFSYIITQRNNAIAMEDLNATHSQATASALQNVETLQLENSSLTEKLKEKEEENSALEEKNKKLEEKISSLQSEFDSLSEFATENEKSVELLISLEQALAEKDYAKCKEIVSEGESRGKNFTDNLTESQKEQWDSACEALKGKI